MPLAGYQYPPAPPRPPSPASQEQEAWRLNPQSLEEFVNLWSEYDDGSGSIAPQDLESLLLRRAHRLGRRGKRGVGGDMGDGCSSGWPRRLRRWLCV